MRTSIQEQVLAATSREGVDVALRPLLPAVRQSLRDQRAVLAVQLWQPIPALALLPFHLQLRWPDLVGELPLTLTMALAPYRQADRVLADVPLYTPEQVYDQTRMVARWYRTEVGELLPGDLELQDWEVGYRQHRVVLQGRVLPGAAYIPIGRVSVTGELARPSSRPVLGRYLGRGAPRPLLLVPGSHADTEAARAQLAAAGYVILNAQGLGGQRTRQQLATLLAARHAAPTLCVAASPSEILALAQEWPIASTLPLLLIGTPPPLAQVAVRMVGRDRPQEETRFEDAVTALRGYDARLEQLLDVAEHTWWAARQSLWADAEACDRLLLAYRRTLDRVRYTASAEIGLLTSATHLLEQTAADAARAGERLAVLEDVVEEQLIQAWGRRTLVVVGQGADVPRLRQHLCTQLGLDAEHLHAAGITIRSARAITGEQCEVLIAVGYQGMHTLDSPLVTRAKAAHFILDPIEARVALAHVAQLTHLLDHASWAQTTSSHPALPAQAAVMRTFTLLRERLTSAAAPRARSRVALDFNVPSVSAFPVGARQSPPGNAPTAQDGACGQTLEAHVLITCTDGAVFLWPAAHRVEVLDASVRGLRALAASELCAGDELIVVARESQELFSEQLLRSLDEGELRQERATRDQWLLLVGGMRRLEQRTFKSVQTGLQRRGCSVSLVTVRSWLPDPEHSAEGIVPRTWAEFHALAQELNVPMDERTLRSTYQAVKRWRVLHRSYGRRLVRLMRHAVLGHLDAVTLDRVQARWGWRTRDLIAGISLHSVEACTSA